MPLPIVTSVSIGAALLWISFPIDTSCYLLAGASAFEKRSLDVSIILLAGCFPRKPQPISVCTEILVTFEGETRRPVRIGAMSPRFFTPPGIHEVDRLGNFLVAEHLAEDFQNLGLGFIVRLVLNNKGLIRHDSRDKDAAAREKFWNTKWLENGIVASFRASIQQVLRGPIPKDLIGRKLQENFGVNTYIKCFDGGLLPAWERRSEVYFAGFEDANGEGANSVVGIDTRSIGIMNCDALFTPLNFLNDGVQEEPGIIWFEKSCSFAANEDIETTRIMNELISL